MHGRLDSKGSRKTLECNWLQFPAKKVLNFVDRKAKLLFAVHIWSQHQQPIEQTMNLEHTTAGLNKALAQAQSEVENATKGSINPHFKNRYADLAEVLNTVRPVFASHGLSIVQSTSYDGSLVSVTTTILHAEGGYISSTASCVPAKSDAQGVGASTTYLRRYALAAMTGIAQEDDDGQSASHTRTAAPASKEDVASLKTRMEGLGVDEEAFLKYLAVKSLSELTKPAVAKANASLDAKAKKVGGAA
jgi:hypothetical protein